METFSFLSFSLCYLLNYSWQCVVFNQPRIDRVATMKSNQLVSISRNVYPILFYIVLTLFLQ